jgi:hypothetical protein
MEFTMTPLTLGSFVALQETQYNNILQARDALYALAALTNEVACKAVGSEKDGYMHIPAEGMGSLLLCIFNNMDTVGTETVPSLVHRFTTQQGARA